MEVLWRLPHRGAGERPHSDCCSGEGLETDRPRMAPSVWKLFAHSLCRQCFVSDLFFPWLPISRVLWPWNHTDCGNLSKQSPPPNTGCCACCAYSVLHRVVCVSPPLWRPSMRLLQDELVQRVGVVCPHLAISLCMVCSCFSRVIVTRGAAVERCGAGGGGI